MIEALQQLERDARAEAAGLSDRKALEELKIKYLGRKGLFASVSGRIGEVAPDARREAGAALNRVKRTLEEIFSEKEKMFASSATGPREAVDFSMPGTFREMGSIHPVSRVIEDVCAIFERLGFSVADGYEVEDERHNFRALNIPLDHPACDSFDTFYLENGRLLRSQTSTVQIRVMENAKPPVKIVAPGKVFRPDATDATHSFMFHQIEGLCIDEGIRFSHLKGVLFEFAREYFGPKAKLRFRPHFFPFTEPSAEVDLWWEGRGWLEILGAGMVHPNVLKGVKVDPEKWTGFAFGMGVERMAMLKYGIDDIRMFFENDVRFLKQFP